jgi:hypothetical protein
VAHPARLTLILDSIYERTKKETKIISRVMAHWYSSFWDPRDLFLSAIETLVGPLPMSLTFRVPMAWQVRFALVFQKIKE